jgi:tetratricopeptide (TPR) repeat protein
MQNHERFLRAELLRQLGREEEALGWYSSFQLLGFHAAIYRGPSHLRRGEIYEQAGDREKALEHYSLFIKWWKEADPEFQPQVEEVRRRMARLVGEP